MSARRLLGALLPPSPPAEKATATYEAARLYLLLKKKMSGQERVTRIHSRNPSAPGWDPGPILRHRWGPSSQLSGPIAGFLACVENGQRLRLPSAPFPQRGPTGLHRTQFRNPNRKSRKREKGKKIGDQMLSFARDEVGIAKAMHNF